MTHTKVILADSDELYLSGLSDYFMEKAPKIELILFTQEAKLLEYLKKGGKADVLAVDEAFNTEALLPLAGDGAKLLLSVSMIPRDGFEPVKKYQKSETLLNELLLKYAESKGDIQPITGKKHTRIAAFYSPAGGSGKTTLSLAVSAAASSMGHRVIWLNLEEIDGVQSVLGKTPGTLSEVYLALKTKGMNPGISLASSLLKEPEGGFYYLSGTETISHSEEVSGEELSRLLSSIRSLADYDLVIIDLSSGFNEKIRMVLEASDVIFVPVVSEEYAVEKVKRLMAESGKHDLYHSIFGKMNLVINKAGSEGTQFLQDSGIFQELPCCAAIARAEIFTRLRETIRAGSTLEPVMEPLIQTALNM